MTNDTVKRALIQHGIPLRGTENPAPIVNVRQTIEAICSNCEIPLLPVYAEPITIRNPAKELLSSNDIKRGMALTMLVKQGNCNRDMLWRYVNDKSPRVKKVAIWALEKPLDEEEKKRCWKYFDNTKDNTNGIREIWGYILLNGANKEELDKWMSFITDKDINVRLSVRNFLKRYFPEAPDLEHTPDPSIDIIPQIVQPVLEWYKKYKDLTL